LLWPAPTRSPAHCTPHCRLKVISELQELVDRKEALIALVSHELRTPLNGIIGLSGSLADSLAPAPPASAAEGHGSGNGGNGGSRGSSMDGGADMRRGLAIIRGSGARLLALVNDMLDAAALRKASRAMTHRAGSVPCWRSAMLAGRRAGWVPGWQRAALVTARAAIRPGRGLAAAAAAAAHCLGCSADPAAGSTHPPTHGPLPPRRASCQWGGTGWTWPMLWRMSLT
jgi:hypothetical protein